MESTVRARRGWHDFHAREDSSAACDDHAPRRQEAGMALKATISKVELQVNDIDRNYYGTHSLTLAQHPSETDERMMARLLAFALNASERLAFGRGISTEDEPDIWSRDLTGVIELWIEIGQPDESRLRRACGRAAEVRVYTFSGRGAGIWWQKNAGALERCSNLRVFDVPTEASQQLASLAARNMQVQVLVQDGHVQMSTEAGGVDIDLATLR
jgi:uncharacterized protein YaeQ